jgi:hypothetical protein
MFSGNIRAGMMKFMEAALARAPLSAYLTTGIVVGTA